MKRKDILKEKERGKSDFQIYEELAGRLSLYHIAFFSAKNAKGRARLHYHWLTILRVTHPDLFVPGTLKMKRGTNLVNSF